MGVNDVGHDGGGFVHDLRDHRELIAIRDPLPFFLKIKLKTSKTMFSLQNEMKIDSNGSYFALFFVENKKTTFLRGDGADGRAGARTRTADCLRRSRFLLFLIFSF